MPKQLLKQENNYPDNFYLKAAKLVAFLLLAITILVHSIIFAAC